MPSSSIKIELNDPVAKYRPGDTLSGILHLNVLTSLKVKYIEVKLAGDCGTSVLERESYNSSHDSRNNNETFSNLKNENVAFLRIESKLSDEAAFSPGEYQFPFSMRIPTHCSNNKHPLNIDWLSTPLPSTVDEISTHGSIKYVLRAVVSQRGLMTANLTSKKPIRIVGKSSWNPSSELFEQRKFVQQKLNIKLYEYESESYGQWTKRLVGMDTSTGTFPLALRISHFAAGLPSWRESLDKLVSIHVFKPEGLEKKGLDFKVHQITAKIKYLLTCVVSGTVTSHEISVDLFDRHQFGDYKLEFVPSGNGQLVCDLSPLLKDTENVHAGECCPPFVTERVPNLSVSAALQIDVGISPTLGNPIRPQYARLKSVVNFYDTPNHELPFIPTIDDGEVPPPYASD